jgi:hypothetical protein
LFIYFSYPRAIARATALSIAEFAAVNAAFAVLRAYTSVAELAAAKAPLA